MTIIPVNEKYRIELDSHSWQVSELRKRKKAENGFCWQGVAWFPRLSQCCEWLVARGLRESEVEGALQVENALNGIEQRLATAITASGLSDIALAEKRRGT